MAIRTGDGPPDLEVAMRLAEKYPFVYATIGVHPHDGSKATEETFERLRELARHPKVLAIGEIGLDYHDDFRRQCSARCSRRAAPGSTAGNRLYSHARSLGGYLDVFRARWQGEGIMHCFTGDEAQAREALDLGFYLSFGGVLTFPKAETLRQAAKIAPADRMQLDQMPVSGLCRFAENGMNRLTLWRRRGGWAR